MMLMSILVDWCQGTSNVYVNLFPVMILKMATRGDDFSRACLAKGRLKFPKASKMSTYYTSYLLLNDVQFHESKGEREVSKSSKYPKRCLWTMDIPLCLLLRCLAI